MALITSAASGNFSAGATWTGGVVPGVGDEARASTGHTITIDVNTTCDEISNAGSGKFVINNGVTLTANVTHKSTTATTNCLEFSEASPASASVVGDCTGGSGSGASKHGISNTSSGTLNITGNCFGGTTFNGNPAGANNQSTGIINITGNCTGGASGQSGRGCNNNSTGTINITGNCTGGVALADGAFNNSTGTLTITGNCIGGTSTGSGAHNNTIGTLTVIGTIQASQTAAGVAGTNAQQVTILSGPFLTETTRGVNPVTCLAWRWNTTPSNSTYLEVMTNDLLAKRSLYTADNITGMPDEADVKDGVVYGPSSELTGTFEQTVSPDPADIATAVWSAATRTITEGGITAADVWSHATRTITGGTVDTLTNAPTVPSASAIASQVRTELEPELTKVSALNTDRLGQCVTTNILGTLLAQSQS